jgi:hypothetical protein
MSEQYRMLGLTREEADFLTDHGYEVVVVPGAEGRLALYWAGRDASAGRWRSSGRMALDAITGGP